MMNLIKKNLIGKVVRSAGVQKTSNRDTGTQETGKMAEDVWKSYKRHINDQQFIRSCGNDSNSLNNKFFKNVDGLPEHTKNNTKNWNNWQQRPFYKEAQNLSCMDRYRISRISLVKSWEWISIRPTNKSNSLVQATSEGLSLSKIINLYPMQSNFSKITRLNMNEES